MGTPSMLVGARTAYLRTPHFNRLIGRLIGKAITSIKALSVGRAKSRAPLKRGVKPQIESEVIDE